MSDALALTLLAVAAVSGLWWCWTRLSDWAYDGDWPNHDAGIGDTFRDESGKLWIYTHDNVGSCFWVPGHIWARIKERHNLAIRSIGR